MVLLDCSKLQLGRGRRDDSVAAFRRRLEVFRELSLPMLKSLDQQHRLIIVNIVYYGVYYVVLILRTVGRYLIGSFPRSGNKTKRRVEFCESTRNASNHWRKLEDEKIKWNRPIKQSVALSSASVQGLKFKRRTECLSTNYLLPTLLYAG